MGTGGCRACEAEREGPGHRARVVSTWRVRTQRGVRRCMWLGTGRDRGAEERMLHRRTRPSARRLPNGAGDGVEARGPDCHPQGRQHRGTRQGRPRRGKERRAGVGARGGLGQGGRLVGARSCEKVSPPTCHVASPARKLACFGLGTAHHVLCCKVQTHERERAEGWEGIHLGVCQMEIWPQLALSRPLLIRGKWGWVEPAPGHDDQCAVRKGGCACNEGPTHGA